MVSTGHQDQTHRYVVIVVGLIIVPVGVSQGTIKRSHCSGNKEDKIEELEKERYPPTEKYPYLLLRFYETYTYYIYT